MSDALTRSGAAALERQAEAPNEKGEYHAWQRLTRESPDAEVVAALELERVVEFIARVEARRVALQFPDWMLRLSPRVVQLLQARVPAEVRVFILGDTSYGADCIDEVAALHLGADSVIHFGPASPAATSALPVLYVLGRESLDLERTAAVLFERLSGAHARAAVLLFASAEFLHGLGALRDLLLARGVPNVVAPALLLEHVPTKEGAVDGVVGTASASASASSDSGAPPTATRTIEVLGSAVSFPVGVEDEGDLAIVYLGTDGPRLVQLLLRFPGSSVVVYDPTRQALVSAPAVTRLVNKRFGNVELGKVASMVGIVVGTLALARFRDVVETLQRLLRRRGVKCYTFVVGKLNPAKLANFPEIDVFVLVAGGDQALLLESRDFLRPVLSPHELLLALCPSIAWSGRILTDFGDVLRLAEEAGEGTAGGGAARRRRGKGLDGRDKGEGEDEHGGADDERGDEEDHGDEGEDDDDDDENDAPFFSLVTGGYVDRRPLRADGGGGSAARSPSTTSSTAMVVASSAGPIVVHDPASAAARMLATRTWHGLDPSVPADATAEIHEGWHGIAASFVGEGGAGRGVDKETTKDGSA